MARTTPDRRFPLLAAGIALLAAAVFAGLARNGFVGYDDPEYVTANPWVRAGLTLPGARWAFTTTHAANWHPLAWLSHMLDVQLFGMAAGAHHLVSLALHAANSLLLLALLRALTGALWPAALVAALFAAHPLHVESVAWAAERKDVLATLFCLLAAAAYARALRRRGEAGRAAWPPALFALALLAKPMPVTLPFLLLLLDWWPLARWSPTGGPGAPPRPRAARLLPPLRLWVEKAPLFLLAAASSAATLHAQRAGAATVPFDVLPLGARLAGALAGYLRYLGTALWPRELVVFRPWDHAATAPACWVPALLALAALTALALAAARRWPWLAVGWLWFAGSLVPVIGLVQVGGQAIADRYTYLPLTGLFVAAAWTLAAAARRRPALAAPVFAATAVALAALALAARAQVAVWRSGETLMRHALAIDPGNTVALNNLGLALAKEGRVDEAETLFRRSLAGQPRQAMVLSDLGRIAEIRGDDAAALAAYRGALALDPVRLEALVNLGAFHAARGRIATARGHFEAAVRAAPGNVAARLNLARALLLEGRGPEAAAQLREAVRLDPFDDEARRLLAEAAPPGR